jgi:glycosyltransferase involved in cell wall biosynthesis
VISLDSERAKAKNKGISYSRGRFLFFVDADMVVEKEVVKDCIGMFTEDQNCAGTIIPERSVGNSFWVKVRDFERSLYAGSKIESARFFLKEHALKVEGFDEELVLYEESTLPQKLEKIGYTVNSRVSSYILHNEDNFSLRKWLDKKKYYAKTFHIYYNKYGEYAKLQLSAQYRIKVLISH